MPTGETALNKRLARASRCGWMLALWTHFPRGPWEGQTPIWQCSSNNLKAEPLYVKLESISELSAPIALFLLDFERFSKHLMLLSYGRVCVCVWVMWKNLLFIKGYFCLCFSTILLIQARPPLKASSLSETSIISSLHSHAAYFYKPLGAKYERRGAFDWVWKISFI